MSSQLLKKLKKLESLIRQHPALNETLTRELDAELNQMLLKLDSPAPEINEAGPGPIQIWSDGACTGNPGPGGWGTIVEIGNQRTELSGMSRKTTNNIMEMTGALEGIKKTPAGSVITLTSDSQYLVKGMTSWIKSWKAKDWKKADGKPVLNKELWVELDLESQKREITWVWVKGHAGHPENERCDELARKAIPQ